MTLICQLFILYKYKSIKLHDIVSYSYIIFYKRKINITLIILFKYLKTYFNINTVYLKA